MDVSASGSNGSQAVSTSKNLEGGDGVGQVGQVRVAMNGAAKFGPNVPGGNAGVGTGGTQSSSGICFNSTKFSAEVKVAGGVTSFQEG